jgi:hypothetical protein
MLASMWLRDPPRHPKELEAHMDHLLLVRCSRWCATAALAGAVLLATAPAALAQVTAAAGYTPPDDTPSIKVGGTIFADYTFQSSPTSTDAAGNVISPNSFNVSRAYINITGNVSHIIAFRITPDVTRESGTGSSLNGSMTYRLKYAFAQINLDDWLPKGSWIRVGLQQTPYLDYTEGFYRYRFQGTLLPEREGYMTSSDAGVSFHSALPNNYGDFHVGVYNGEGYSKAEANNEKSFQGRLSFRPLPRDPLLKGWRLTGFVTLDNYMENAERNRYILQTSFEHPYVNVGVDYLKTADKASSALTNGVDLNPTLKGTGFGIWMTPKKVYANGSSIEALIRYDHTKPGGAVSGAAITSPDALNARVIGGIAYWFPKQGSVSAAIMFDVDNTSYSNWTPVKPTSRKFFVHSLISF